MRYQFGWRVKTYSLRPRLESCLRQTGQCLHPYAVATVVSTYVVICVVCASDKINKSNRPWHECGEMGRGGVCLNIGFSELELLKRKCFKGSSPRKDCKEDSLRPSLRCKGVLGFVCMLEKDARMTTDRSCQRYTNCESVKQCVYGRLEGSIHIAHGHY